MWMFDYFVQELGATIITNELEMERGGKKFYLHHGDGLGPGDQFYKFLKKFFRSKVCQWLFARLHPNLGVGIANAWSHQSRIASKQDTEKIQHQQEWLEAYSLEVLKSRHFDYFVFGHRHLPLDIALPDNSRYVNLGEWVNYNTYAVFDGVNLELKWFEKG